MKALALLSFKQCRVHIETDGGLHCCRYVPGQRFGRHIDESVQLAQGKQTRYTLLIYLAGSGSMVSSKGKAASQQPAGQLQGGATVFYGELLSTAEHK